MSQQGNGEGGGGGGGSGGEGSVQFRWGRKRAQYYESFTYNGVHYSIYDCVYIWCRDEPEPSIGKLVKIYEKANGEKTVKVVWFFRPVEIQNFLGDVKHRPNEPFLASGKGKGHSNSYIHMGKCSVICTSKDRRNPWPTEEEFTKADYVFSRTFDVRTHTISNIFPDYIAEVEVKNYFNRRKDLKPLHPAKGATSANPEHSGSLPPTMTLGKKACSFIKDYATGVPDTSSLRKRKLEYAPGVPETSQLKRKCESSLDVPDISLSKKIKLEKHSGPFQSKASQGNGSDDREVNLDNKVGKLPSRADYLEKIKSMITNYQMTEVARRPNEEASGWFKEQPWKTRMLTAQDEETLVLLENLDPSFTSADVEDILWHVFKMKAGAKMIQHGTFSSLHSGQAFVIFKSKEAADSVIFYLKTQCLMLGDGRPLIAQNGALKEPSNPSDFFGHFTIGRMRQRTREVMRTAVSTAHYSQNNTIKYEMALEWFKLQELSNQWRKALYEEHAKEIAELKSKYKIPLLTTI